MTLDTSPFTIICSCIKHQLKLFIFKITAGNVNKNCQIRYIISDVNSPHHNILNYFVDSSLVTFRLLFYGYNFSVIPLIKFVYNQWVCNQT